MSVLDRNSVLAAGLVIVTLLLGMVSGVALDRWLLRPQHEFSGPPRRGGPDGGRGRFDPAQFRTQFGGQLARELALTPAQKRAVDSILGAQQEKSRAVMREMSPRLQQVAESTQAALRQVLTAEQWEKMQKLRQERMRRDGPRRRGGPEHGSPPEPR